MRSKPTLTLIAISLLITSAGQAQKLRIGEAIPSAFESPHPYDSSRSETPQLVFRQEIYDPGASYIAPHFSRMELAAGDHLIVRSPDGSRSWRYERYGKLELGRAGGEGFWGIRVPGDRAIIELHAGASGGAYGFSIDRYGRGYDQEPALPGSPSKSICTADDKENAACYATSNPAHYEEARSVVRLFISGSFLCTGWLLGDEGHMMTNNHCIGNATEAMNTDYEFMAEGATCATNCPQLGCDGTLEATTATLVQTSVNLDYALVALPTNLSGTYGFMQLRETGAVLDERIWSPQHPGGRGKEFAVLSTYAADPSGFAEVDGLTEPVCQGGSDLEVGYWMDTEGGSSGSPVLGWDDNLVVALHHCRGAAFCSTGNPGNDDPNRGVAIPPIIADLGANLPNNALGLASNEIFSDTFESGDSLAWSNTIP